MVAANVSQLLQYIASKIYTMAHVINKHTDKVQETTDSHAAFLVKNRPDRFCLAEEVKEEEEKAPAVDNSASKVKEEAKSKEPAATEPKQEPAPKAKRTRKPRTTKANTGS